MTPADDDDFSFDPTKWAKKDAPSGGDGAASGANLPKSADTAAAAKPDKKPSRLSRLKKTPKAKPVPEPASTQPPPPAASVATGTTSFNPREWTKLDAGGEEPATDKPAAATSGDAPPREDTSFNPREWTKIGGAAIDAPPPADGAPPPRKPRLALILGGVAALSLAGAGGWYALSPAPPPPKQVAKAAPAPRPKIVMPAGNTRTVQVGSVDQIVEALKGAGVDAAVAAKVVGQLRGVLQGASDIRLQYTLTGPTTKPVLAAIEATREDGQGMVLIASADQESGFKATKLEAKLTPQVRTVRGEMDATSFYSAAVAAGLDDSLIDEFAKAFSFDFDFQQEVAPGDIFEAAIEEQINPAGQKVGEPRLVYVSLATRTKSKALYRFSEPGEAEPGWFDANGGSTVRALMRTPVDGARVTSKFGPRLHPTLGYTRLHGGTDFGAPVGTPIYAAASGTVSSASPSTCAGNMVIIRHDNGWETRYFHLSRYADGLVAGSRVTQGSTIGDVGNTGTCTTGPHLHYEVHINGEKVDPLSIDTGSAKRLEADALSAFKKERDRIDSARASSGA